MSEYVLEVRGDAREIYAVEADSEEEARALFEAGEVTEPTLVEVSGVEIVSIEEVRE